METLCVNLNTLALAPERQQHLDAHGADPRKVLDDVRLLRNHVVDFNDDTVGDAFRACCEYTLQLSSRRKQDGLRWCFTMLLYFDLVKLIRHTGSGRVGHLMQKEVTRFQEPTLGTISPKLALKQLNEWSRHGMKINVLCAEFRPGCLFYLGDLLIPDFLSTKFTATGNYHDEAFSQLRTLGLHQKVRESVANELSCRVRELPIRPFQIASRSPDGE